MPNKLTRRCVPLLVCLLIFPPLTRANANTSDQLNHRIERLKTSLYTAQTERNRLNTALAQTETRSGKLTRELRRLHAQLRQQKTVLEALNQQKTAFEHQLIHQRKTLLEQIKAAYMLGQKPFIKLLLNQENPERISRLITYYHYVNRNRLHNIEALHRTLAQFDNNQQQITTHYQQLKKLTEDVRAKQKHLAKSQASRERLLNRLNRRIQSRHQRLAQLLADKNALEQAVNRIAQDKRLTTDSNLANMGKTFSQLRHHITWPASGQLIARFGTKVEQSTLKWNGVLIKAAQNQPVYAIADGQVVFAKWMPGYGLLLIINHGDGYMTLYGRNHTLYKNVGDRVHAGDAIATVGRSGGYLHPALYFAIRHNAKPLDPAKWCHSA